MKTMFLGGARSGKSRLAQTAAERHAGPLHYLATAEAHDDEMTDRIARHRDDRGARWRTVECPLALPEAIDACTGGAVLVDCLTLWLSNLMLAEQNIDQATDELLAALISTRSQVAVVSNEVGLGIVPENPLARRFRDAAGRLNQAVAARADRAVLLTAGLPLVLKG